MRKTVHQRHALHTKNVAIVEGTSSEIKENKSSLKLHESMEAMICHLNISIFPYLNLNFSISNLRSPAPLGRTTDVICSLCSCNFSQISIQFDYF